MSITGPVKKQEPWTEEQKAILAKKEAEIERLHKDITALAKPLLAATATEDWSKHVTPGTLSVFQEESSWDTIAANSENIIFKHSSSSLKQKVNQYATWEKIMDAYDEAGFSDEEEDDDESVSAKEIKSRTPPKAQFDPKDMKTYGTKLMEEERVVVMCRMCRRPILINSFKAHSDACGHAENKRSCVSTETPKDINKAKLTNSIFSDEEDEENDMRQKKIAITGEAHGSIPTKRPPSNGGENNSNKKKQPSKKEKTKLKGSKPKAPLDLDRQCGVIQGPNNTPCTRSLTCKSHSMGAKRAVAGRSQLYDILLAAYQKKSVGRPQLPRTARVGLRSQPSRNYHRSHHSP
ncbi:SCA7, zinc-binding domain-containing protein [Dichotomocladium elegans]|nr:SCA7, zinc-binding domain-containing protein [Dichotomocladium elegans]